MQKELLKDVNGVEMRTGDIVEITGGFFKSDNGVFLITASPKDTGWFGSYYAMERVNKNGSISTSKSKNGSWPIGIYINNRCQIEYMICPILMCYTYHINIFRRNHNVIIYKTRGNNSKRIQRC